MTQMKRRLVSAAAVGCLTVALGGCGQFRAHQGFVIDQTLTDSIQPGIDNRDSVAKTLGRPTFEGDFDPNTWYYVSRDTKQFAFRSPRPSAQTVIEVRFDPTGNVAQVKRTGLETIAKVDPYSKETPTLGRKTSFFGELFGNIGKVGATGTAAPTSDNPNG